MTAQSATWIKDQLGWFDWQRFWLTLGDQELYVLIVDWLIRRGKNFWSRFKYFCTIKLKVYFPHKTGCICLGTKQLSFCFFLHQPFSLKAGSSEKFFTCFIISFGGILLIPALLLFYVPQRIQHKFPSVLNIFLVHRIPMTEILRLVFG